MIVESPVINFLTAAYYNGTSWVTFTGNLQQVNITRGGKKSVFGNIIEPGIMTFDVLDALDPITVAAVKPSTPVRVSHTNGTLLFTGKIEDIAVEMFRDSNNVARYRRTFVVSDLVKQYSDKLFDEYSTMSSTYEYPYEDISARLYALVGDTGPLSLTNRITWTNGDGSILDELNRIQRGSGLIWWVGKDNTFKSTAACVSAGRALTHLNTPGKLHYNEARVSYDTRNMVNKVVITNLQGDHAVAINLGKPRPAKQDLNIFETTTVVEDLTSIATYGERKLEFDTAIHATVVKRNHIKGSTPEKQNVPAWDDNGNWSFEPVYIGQDPSGSVFARCTASAPTYQGFYFSEIEAANQFVLQNEYGSGTWWAGAYMRATINTMSFIARISWYDAAGVLISVVDGSPVTLSTTVWKNVSVNNKTAPANAVTARVSMQPYSRAVNQAEAFIVQAAYITEYDSPPFDGFVGQSGTFQQVFVGAPGASETVYLNNSALYSVGQAIVDANKTPQMEISEIRLNGQDNTASCASLDVNEKISIEHDILGTANYQICGIQHNVTANRWMITLNVRKL
jgi:hypothetical protein